MLGELLKAAEDESSFINVHSYISIGVCVVVCEKEREMVSFVCDEIQ